MSGGSGFVKRLILQKGLDQRAEPFRLTSGELSLDYIDGKRAVASGRDLGEVAKEILSICNERNIEFDAVGGMTMGADPLAYAIAVLTGKNWFSIRKEPKDHGTRSQIEGTKDLSGLRVLLLDDVVTTGGSLLRALDVAEAQAAHVVLAVAMVDRGKTTSDVLAARGITFVALSTFEDLGIDPVGNG